MTHRSTKKKQARQRKTAVDRSSPREENRLTTPRDEMLGLQQAAGNHAVGDLLQPTARDGGRPLDSFVQSEMESKFNQDFSQVRIHADSEAAASAKAINASAYTTGNHIVFDEAVYSPNTATGRDLLAHELAHVVQQQQSNTVSPGLSQAGDRHEADADRAAKQVQQGESAHVAATGAPPAIQRQERPPDDRATREEARATVEAYLRRVLEERGWSSVRITPDIRSLLSSLGMNDVGVSLAIDTWLSQPVLPGDPAEFARRFAQRLPETMERERLARIQRATGSAPQRSLPARVGDLIERTGPGRPEPRMEPPGPTSEQRAEQFEATLRATGAVPQPREQRLGPVAIDPFRIGRIIEGLPGALRGERSPRPREPAARAFTEVDSAIEQIPPDSLVPGELRGTPEADEFAGASRAFASDVARRLDIAQQQGQESIQISLGLTFSRARDQAAIISECRRIVLLIRDALPHHASRVRVVELRFGERIVPVLLQRREE